MASSGNEASPVPVPTLPRTPPSLAELSRIGMRSILVRYVENRSTPSQQPGPRMVSVHVSFLNRRITIVDDEDEVEGAGRSSKDKRIPASKSAIEALPTVDVLEEGVECAICLKELKIGGELAKQMPCEHKYHSGCIEKWLEIHGICPICRYEMPVEGGIIGNGQDNNGEEDGYWDQDLERSGDSFENGVVFNYIVDGSTGQVFGADIDIDVRINRGEFEWSDEEGDLVDNEYMDWESDVMMDGYHSV